MKPETKVRIELIIASGPSRPTRQVRQLFMWFNIQDSTNAKTDNWWKDNSLSTDSSWAVPSADRRGRCCGHGPISKSS